MYANRQDAGKKLALILKKENLNNFMVVSLPRGGTVVGHFIAEELGLVHMGLVVRKIGAPDNPELALGATGSNEIAYWDENILKSYVLSHDDKRVFVEKAKEEVKTRENKLGIGLPDVRGKKVFIVDDGVATGATAITASMILRKLGSEENVLVTPVISKSTKKEIGKHFDRIITAELPHDYRAVGEFYESFPQIDDVEVRRLMEK